MKIKNDQLGQAAELRRLAEEIVSGKTASIPENLSPEQMQRVFHELQVHQIELEMQNEELRRTQEELVSARMRYFDLYDLAPVGYCIISKLGLILEANLTLATLLGRAKGILINSPLSSFILTEDQDTFYRCRNTICATGTPQTFELRLKKGKALFWARFVMSAAMDEGGIPIHRVVVSDITDLKHTENELKLLNNTLEQRVLEITAKNREKDHLLIQQSRYAVMGEMIGHVAHQWRQPLNALGLTLANIQDAFNYHELTEEYLTEEVVSGMQLVEKMSSTIDDFRHFFRPDKEPMAFSLAAAINESIAVVSASFRNDNIDVELEFDEDIFIFGYYKAFSQVLLNLLANAKDAIMQNHVASGKVSIKSALEGQTVLITVADNGGGSPEANLERVFEPYFSTKELGTGIGLYMSKMIIEKNMHGKISAVNHGNGAEFAIRCQLAGLQAGGGNAQCC